MITFYGDRKEGWTTMDRRLDHQGRWRHKTVAFRVSQEESEQIDRMVRLSGLTKQDLYYPQAAVPGHCCAGKSTGI